MSQPAKYGYHHPLIKLLYEFEVHVKSFHAYDRLLVTKMNC